MPTPLPELTSEERARYEWQMWTPEFGEEGQRRLKAATVLVSRVGGVGGTVAYYLAAAGIGRLILAHAGNVKPSDLNRQLLMTTEGLGSPRTQSAAERLRELNPNVRVETIAANLNMENAPPLVQQSDVVVDAAPLFTERFAMNAAAFAARKPVVECAMFDMDAQLTTMVPGTTGCLRCLYPVDPPHWKREFPVIGAVSGMIASIAAVEVIKLLTGIGQPLTNSLLFCDLRDLHFRTLPFSRKDDCPVCGTLS